MSIVDIRPSPPPPSFYDDLDTSGWTVEKICQGFAWTQTEYVETYKTIEARMREADLLQRSLALYVNKATLYTVLSNINIRFGSNPPNIPIPWRDKALLELAHKVNTNAIRRKKSDQTSKHFIVISTRIDQSLSSRERRAIASLPSVLQKKA